jgi:hypothetical protein
MRGWATLAAEMVLLPMGMMMETVRAAFSVRVRMQISDMQCFNKSERKHDQGTHARVAPQLVAPQRCAPTSMYTKNTAPAHALHSYHA